MSIREKITIFNHTGKIVLIFNQYNSVEKNGLYIQAVGVTCQYGHSFELIKVSFCVKFYMSFIKSVFSKYFIINLEI